MKYLDNISLALGLVCCLVACAQGPHQPRPPRYVEVHGTIITLDSYEAACKRDTHGRGWVVKDPWAPTNPSTIWRHRRDVYCSKGNMW